MGVRVPPRAAPFSFEKGVVLVGVALFVMHFPCTLNSCTLHSVNPRSVQGNNAEVSI